MTSTLRASTLSAIATFLAFGSPQGSFADGRGDWGGYSWQTIEIGQCEAEGTRMTCPQYHQKWDWKRDQWVDVDVSFDLSNGRLELTQALTDKDSHDRDYVCVTALVADGDGRTLIAHHQNWRIGPGEGRSETFGYSSDQLATAAAIHIGSKQCRDGAGQDDGVYQSVLAAIGG